MMENIGTGKDIPACSPVIGIHVINAVPDLPRQIEALHSENEETEHQTIRIDLMVEMLITLETLVQGTGGLTDNS